MTELSIDERYHVVRRRVRLLTLLRAAADVGLDPLGVGTVHALAYLTDALSPVWHLPPLDGQVLKRVVRPYFPALQRDVDALVGAGLVEVVRFAHLPDEGGRGWRLDADLRLVGPAAAPVLAAVDGLPEQASRAAFVREVVYAASGLGLNGVDRIGLLDATYVDPRVDVGGVIDFAPEARMNPTAQAALGFAALASGVRLSEPELIHLYVRHLYAGLAGV
ncbi:MAG: hypothetical protein WD794_15880 [Mycobacteriales bacterium]